MVDPMCNLSVGVYERAWEKAWDEAWNASLHQERERKKRQLIPDLWGMHMGIPMIAKLAECSEDEVREIAKEMGLR